VAELSRRAGLERAPRLMVLPTPRLEAFTTGRREDAVIAVSDGLLRRLPERELLGVLAHEVSHLAHRDLLVLGTARSLGRFGRFVSRLGLLVVVLSLPAMLWSGQGVSWLLVLALLLAPRFLLSIEQALSRSREFDADAGAAALTGDPEALARALVRVEADAQQRDPMWRLLGMRTVLPPWLQSHPATRERVARLAALRV
jgi:heat shock protein HtpX